MRRRGRSVCTQLYLLCSAMALGSAIRDFEKLMLQLKKVGINSAEAIISQNASSLKKLSGANTRDLLRLRMSLTKQHASMPSSGLSFYHQMETNSSIIVTGHEELDETLDGGFYSGEITLIVKTPGALNLSSIIISKINSKIIFLDTADYFDAAVFEGSCVNFEFVRQIKVFNVIEFLDITENLRQRVSQCSLLVVDCFTDLVLGYVGGMTTDDLVIYIKKVVRSLKLIALHQNVAILLFCRDIEISKNFSLSAILHTMIDSALCSTGDDTVRLTLTKSSKQSIGKCFTLSRSKID